MSKESDQQTKFSDHNGTQVRPEPPRVAPGFTPAPITTPKQGGNFKRGFGQGAGLSLGFFGGAMVLSIAGLILMIILSSIFSSFGQANPKTAMMNVETLWGADTANPEDTVRAISIEGGILGDVNGPAAMQATSGYEVANLIDELGKEDSKGIILMMNTPGGTVYGSKAIADAVTRYQKRTGQKVFAYVRGMSASGGMWAMAGADEIIADYGTYIGSIGIRTGMFLRYRDVTAIEENGTGITTKGGITAEILHKGKGKDFGNSYRDMTKEERANIMANLERGYADFVSWVSKARNIPESKIRQELGAYIFTAKRAKEKGLVDSVMGPDEAFRHIAKSMGIKEDKMRIVKPAPPSPFEALAGAPMRIYGQVKAVEPGQKITSSLCTSSTQVLALHGSIEAICG